MDQSWKSIRWFLRLQTTNLNLMLKEKEKKAKSSKSGIHPLSKVYISLNVSDLNAVLSTLIGSNNTSLLLDVDVGQNAVSQHAFCFDDMNVHTLYLKVLTFSQTCFNFK